MLYRDYGASGVSVSTIGFGGMRFEDQKNVEACAELVKAAYDAGINYFDTAPGYGDSEKLFGVAFRDMLKTRAERPFYVSTKTGQAQPDGVRRDLEQSLARMGLDCIDFYHVWCVLSLDSYRQRKANGVLKEFEKLKDEGLVKHICISSHMPGADIADVLRDYPFEGVLLGYSAMNFAYREAALDAAAKLKRGVMAMNPLGGGVIPQHPERFDFIRRGRDISVVEGALQFIIDDPRISAALVGFSNRDHLQQALRAVDEYAAIPDSELDNLRAGLSDAFNELCTGCRYCDQCPQDISIPELMEGYNHYLLSGDKQSMLNRLAWHWGIGIDNDEAARCTACGLCEKACTQHLPIIERLKVIREAQATACAAASAKD